MTIAIIQTAPVWGDIAHNHLQAERLILSAPQADLYVLPEMWATGFWTSPDDVAEHITASPTLAWMIEMAARRDAAIAGSVAIRASDETYRNRMFFVRPDGTFDHYDKRHLFSYGGEDRRYTAGGRRKVVEWRGVRFLLQICYDLRFPVFSRNDSDYDVALYVASWPESRIDVWRTLLKARAIENQCYAVGVNRCGDDPVAHYCGATMAFDAYGNVVASCEDNTESVGVMTVDMERLTRFRERFPVLADADHIIKEDNTPWR